MSSQRSDWRERLHANPSRMEQELAFRLQQDWIFYQTQVEIPVTIADFYFPTQPRPLIAFVDGRVHLGKAQMFKDEELRTLLRKKGYQVLELSYEAYSNKRRDELYLRILEGLGNEKSSTVSLGSRCTKQLFQPPDSLR
jgi:very-short-patch-repair endonuclease